MTDDIQPKKGQSFDQRVEQLNLLLAEINSNELSVELLDLNDAIIGLWSIAMTPQEKIACIDLAAALSIKDLSDSLLEGFTEELYEDKEYNTAFYGYIKGAQKGIIDSKNNLAYMVRRNESKYEVSNRAFTALKLLIPGVKQREPFCLVNTALVLCLLMKDNNDWKLADSLFHFITSKEQRIADWWLNQEDATERDLVHFFLLRHRKIDGSKLGSIKSIVLRLKTEIDWFPDWLSEEYLA